MSECTEHALSNYLRDYEETNMPRFRFALSDIGSVREVGMVQSDTFDDALSAVTERFAVTPGDELEIGVHGFPPARYLYVTMMDSDSSTWRPVGQRAA